MGCLFELMSELIVDVYVHLMCMFLPEKVIGKAFRFVLEMIVTVVAVLFIISILLGGLMLWADVEGDTRTLAKYMIVIPIAISGIQIILGIVVRIWAKKK